VLLDCPCVEWWVVKETTTQILNVLLMRDFYSEMRALKRLNFCHTHFK